MSKRVKEMVIEELKGRIGSCTDMLVIDSSRLDAVTDNRFRLDLGKKGITVLTVKNALARRALNGLGVDTLDPFLAGPSSLVWGGEDIVALSKEMAKVAKDLGTLEIKGGTVDGTSLNADDVQAISKSPGRVELIGQIATLALSPGARLAGALLGPGGTVVGQAKSISEGAE